MVSGKLPNEISMKKPDGLLVFAKGAVKAYSKYKMPTELKKYVSGGLPLRQKTSQRDRKPGHW